MVEPIIEIKARLRNSLLDVEILEERGLYSMAARVLSCYVDIRFNDGTICISLCNSNGQGVSKVVKDAEAAYEYIESQTKRINESVVHQDNLDLSPRAVGRIVNHLKNGERDRARQLLPVKNEESAQVVLGLIKKAAACGEEQLLDEVRTPVPDKQTVPEANDGLPF
jgi:hypothetical protein